jgi:hypothetical protein
MRWRRAVMKEAPTAKMSGADLHVAASLSALCSNMRAPLLRGKATLAV